MGFPKISLIVKDRGNIIIKENSMQAGTLYIYRSLHFALNNDLPGKYQLS